MFTTPSHALLMMRKYSEIGVPFSFTFNSYNKTKNLTDGLKEVKRAVLRLGLRNDQSDQANLLIAYIDLDKEEAPRFFRLSLLQSFNNYKIKP
jgi:hypothetical protein